MKCLVEIVFIDKIFGLQKCYEIECVRFDIFWSLDWHLQNEMRANEWTFVAGKNRDLGVFCELLSSQLKWKCLFECLFVSMQIFVTSAFILLTNCCLNYANSVAAKILTSGDRLFAVCFEMKWWKWVEICITWFDFFVIEMWGEWFFVNCWCVVLEMLKLKAMFMKYELN
jgi:hypothetical protein